jgi:hypothetical protein
LIFSILLTGCPSGEQPKTNANQPANTGATKPTNSGSNLTPTTPTPESTTNDAPTVKPVVTAYCDAWTKKDEAALRKVYSQGTLKSFEADMKADNEKSLIKHLDADVVSNKLCEVRNEKIEGDVAIAELKTEGAPNGFKVKFVKENGEWKLTNEFPDFPKKSSESSNTAK